jgi:hypothetical protein
MELAEEKPIGRKSGLQRRWATWSEALAAGAEVFPVTKEQLDV